MNSVATGIAADKGLEVMNKDPNYLLRYHLSMCINAAIMFYLTHSEYLPLWARLGCGAAGIFALGFTHHLARRMVDIIKT
jgi:hypothetical protein